MEVEKIDQHEGPGAAGRAAWGSFTLIGLGAVLLLATILFEPYFKWLWSIRLALGLVFVLYVPGYCLTAALFPRAADLDGIERTGLSLGLSIAFAPLLALLLDLTPWGIRLWSVLIGELSSSLFFMTIAIVRQSRLEVGEAYAPDIFPHLGTWWRDQTPGERRIYLICAAALLLGIAGTAWVFSAAPQTGLMTEFYIMGTEGLAENYPHQAVIGEPLNVLAGITNREGTPATYHIVAVVDGTQVGMTGPLTLIDGQTWQGSVPFSMPKVGTQQKVEFLLEREGHPFPYRKLQLWLDVE